MSSDPFSVLQCSPSSSLQEIRLSYLRLARIYHPDRSKDAASLQKFEALEGAWKKVQQLHDINSSAPIQIDLDDMEFNEENEEYRFGCRCGDIIRATCKDLEQGFNTFNCVGCSASIHVSFELDVE